MNDHRSALVKARDKWLASDEALRLQGPGAVGRYLEVRLEQAFIAGWAACEAQFGVERERKAKP